MLRRRFLKSSSMVLAALGIPAVNRAMMRAEDKAGVVPQKSYPPLTGPFRLPTEWYRATTARFQNQLASKSLSAAVISDRHSINYLTGAFAITTERPIWLLVPAKGDPAIFHPGLDRDLWDSWWIRDRQWYFDYRHHGQFNSVVWQAGATTDLFQWMIDGLVKRNFNTGSVAFETRPSDEQLQALKKASIKAEWKIAAPMLLHMRMVKTSEEIALDRLAISLHDRMMDFARSYILTHGTDATDFEVAHATEAFGASELTEYLKLTGRPHTGVGVDIGFDCRTGVATAYPHPNQFFYKKIERGDALQIAAGVRIGGYGGEGYRAMQVAGTPNALEDLRSRMWEVHTAMTLEVRQRRSRCRRRQLSTVSAAQAKGTRHRTSHLAIPLFWRRT